MIGGDAREREGGKGREVVRRGGRDRRKGRGRVGMKGKRGYADDVEVGGLYTDGEGQSASRAARTSDTRDRLTQCLQGQHTSRVWDGSIGCATSQRFQLH